jgi:chemotaxis response regulator CheB
VLIDMPQLLRQIIRDVVDTHPDMTVVRVHPRRVPLVEAVDRDEAQVVVFGQESAGLSRECRELLEVRPRVQVLTVSGDGTATTSYGLRSHREPFGEVEPAQLADAIRAVAARSEW